MATTELPYLGVDEIEAKATELAERQGMIEVPIDVVALAVREGLSVNLARFDDQSISGQIVRDGDSKISIYVRKLDPPIGYGSPWPTSLAITLWDIWSNNRKSLIRNQCFTGNW